MTYSVVNVALLLNFTFFPSIYTHLKDYWEHLFNFSLMQLFNQSHGCCFKCI